MLLFVGDFIQLTRILNDARQPSRGRLHPALDLPVKQSTMLEVILGSKSSAVGVCRSKALAVVMLGQIGVFLVLDLAVEQGDQRTADNFDLHLATAGEQCNEGIFGH